MVNESKLTHTEKLILNTRRTSSDFSELTELNMRISLDKIILNGAAISGCKMPETEFFAAVLAEQIQSLILNLNAVGISLDEIILAMQLNVSGDLLNRDDESVIVDFKGNCFNVAYLAKVLKNYLVLRHTLDRKIENQLNGYE